MSEANPTMTKIADLKLADTVKLFEGPWGTGIVTQINEGLVTIMRPYGSTSDFSCTSGVIFYTGLETCTYLIQSDARLPVYYGKELR